MPDEEKSIIEPTNPDVAEVEVKKEVAAQTEETTKESETETPAEEVAEEIEVEEIEEKTTEPEPAEVILTTFPVIIESTGKRSSIPSQGCG